MEDMQHVGHRITFLGMLRVVSTLWLAAISVILLTPSTTSALDLDLKLDTVLSQTLGQVAKTTNLITGKLKKEDRQSENRNGVASELPEKPTAEPAIAIPVPPPTLEALPPKLESIESLATVPSRQQLLALLSEPLLMSGSLSHGVFSPHSGADSFSMLRPSPEGWKILGVSWVWWITGLGAVWLGARWVKWRF